MEYQSNVISNSRSRAKELFSRLGGAPSIAKPCACDDEHSCDDCRAVRRQDPVYQAWLQAEMKIHYLVSFVSSGSHSVSGMACSPRPELQASIPKFYKDFQEKFNNLFGVTVPLVDSYVSKYGHVELEDWKGNYFRP